MKASQWKNYQRKLNVGAGTVEEGAGDADGACDRWCSSGILVNSTFTGSFPTVTQTKEVRKPVYRDQSVSNLAKETGSYKPHSLQPKWCSHL